MNQQTQIILAGTQAALARHEHDEARAAYWTSHARKMIHLEDNPAAGQAAFDSAYRAEAQSYRRSF